ncbi:MAG: hypothetical protein ABT14_14095 [Pelagibacterium sp. SCN 63-17]|nr:MAG: hypothetical protein ABT14_14095 [Pelagibacterium sp. SCN 63-17]
MAFSQKIIQFMHGAGFGRFCRMAWAILPGAKTASGACFISRGTRRRESLWQRTGIGFRVAPPMRRPAKWERIE